MQKKQATKLEQLKHLKAAKNAQKQEEEVKQPKDFKQAKELKHPKQGRDTSYVSLHQIPTKDLHFSTMRHLNNPTFSFWESKWVTGLHGLLVWFWRSPRMIALQLDFVIQQAYPLEIYLFCTIIIIGGFK